MSGCRGHFWGSRSCCLAKQRKEMVPRGFVRGGWNECPSFGIFSADAAIFGWNLYVTNVVEEMLMRSSSMNANRSLNSS